MGKTLKMDNAKWYLDGCEAIEALMLSTSRNVHLTTIVERTIKTVSTNSEHLHSLWLSNSTLGVYSIQMCLFIHPEKHTQAVHSNFTHNSLKVSLPHMPTTVKLIHSK